MNRFRIIGGGTKRLVSFMLLAILLVSFQTLGTFAANEGDSIKFKLTENSAGEVFTADGDYMGTCAFYGLPTPDHNGTATVEKKYSNSSNMAKIVYYYGYQQGWLNNDDWAYSKHTVLACLTQICNMGYSEWYSVWSQNPTHTAETAAWIKGFWDERDNLPDAPANFECLLMNQGAGNQPFVISRIARTGFLKVKKVSSNTLITG